MKPSRFLLPLIGLILIASLILVNIPAQAASPAAPDLGAPAADGTPEPGTSVRPIVLVQSYSASNELKPGKDFDLVIALTNSGSSNAVDIILSFAPGDMIPRDTGGALSVRQIVPGETKSVRQPMTLNSTAVSGAMVSTAVSVTYNDQTTGASYSAAFNLSLRVSGSSGGGGAAPTATATPIVRPQLVISAYQTDVDPLQPGTPFTVQLDVSNLGNDDAKNVTMIMGGGGVPTSGQDDTNDQGGISGASGQFTDFAPLKSSNIQYLGDLAAGKTINGKQSLIVNVTTKPGAYSVKFSFMYVDSKGKRYTDDQVITLLVYALPMVEINFYREAGPFFAGQPGPLPIQINNLSRNSVVLGSMKVTAKDAEVMNNSVLVGPLDPGGYFPLDATLIPTVPGPLEITVTVNYTDDFNQSKTLTQTLNIDVQEAPVMEPAPGDTTGVPGDQGVVVTEPQAPETFWQKAVRFFKGLIGLDSGQSQPVPIGPAEMGSGGEVIPVEKQSIQPDPSLKMP